MPVALGPPVGLQPFGSRSDRCDSLSAGCRCNSVSPPCLRPCAPISRPHRWWTMRLVGTRLPVKITSDCLDPPTVACYPWAENSLGSPTPQPRPVHGEVFIGDQPSPRARSTTCARNSFATAASSNRSRFLVNVVASHTRRPSSVPRTNETDAVASLPSTDAPIAPSTASAATGP